MIKMTSDLVDMDVGVRSLLFFFFFFFFSFPLFFLLILLCSSLTPPPINPTMHCACFFVNVVCFSPLKNIVALIERKVT